MDIAIAIDRAETRADWVVDKNQVRELVPGAVIVFQCFLVFQAIRSDFHQRAILRAAPRTAVDPARTFRQHSHKHQGLVHSHHMTVRCLFAICLFSNRQKNSFPWWSGVISIWLVCQLSRVWISSISNSPSMLSKQRALGLSRQFVDKVMGSRLDLCEGTRHQNGKVESCGRRGPQPRERESDHGEIDRPSAARRTG